MGILKKTFKTMQAKSQKAEPGSVEQSSFVATGMDVIDYIGGTIGTTRDKEEFPNVGIPPGKIIIFVGHSQSGKTTLALQTSYNIVKDLGGDVLLFDFERSSSNPRSRIMNITGCTEEEYEETFTIFRSSTLTSEYLKEVIFKIAEEKESLGSSSFIPYIDEQGEEIMIYPPTVVVIDSIASMRTKELLEKADMDNNMVAAAIAKGNSSLLTSVMHLLERYNITLLGINHITTKISINPYAPKKIQLPGLGDDEQLPGGNKFVFLASYIFRLTAGKELKDDKDLCINGRVINCKFIKTRSAFNNKVVPLIYTEKKGFNNVLTNFMYIKDAGLLKGGGRGGFFIEPAPDTKFTQKDFMRVYSSNKKFKKIFDEYISEYLLNIMQSKSGELYTEKQVSKSSKDFSEDFEE